MVINLVNILIECLYPLMYSCAWVNENLVKKNLIDGLCEMMLDPDFPTYQGENKRYLILPITLLIKIK